MTTPAQKKILRDKRQKYADAKKHLVDDIDRVQAMKDAINLNIQNIDLILDGSLTPEQEADLLITILNTAG